MQISHLKNNLKRKAPPEVPLKISLQNKKDKINRVEDPIEQIEDEERQPKYRNNRHDLLDRILNPQARIRIQIILEVLARKNHQSRYRVQQPQNRGVEETHHPQR
jgi:hypothetical protein